MKRRSSGFTRAGLFIGSKFLSIILKAKNVFNSRVI